VKSSVGERVARVAASITSPETFHRRARLAAEVLGPRRIAFLPAFFHKPPSIPDEVKDQFQGLGQWMEVCQLAFADPSSVREYEMFLRRLMHGEMLAGRHPILDGAILELKPDGSE